MMFFVLQHHTNRKMLNNFYNKNIESFKQYQNLNVNFLQENLYLGQGIEFGIEVIENRKVPYVIKENKVYQLDSMYGSSEFIEMWFELIENKNYRSRYIIFGLGNGMYVRKILQEVGSEAEILIFEPSLYLFSSMLNEDDFSDIISNNHVHFILLGNDEIRLRDLLGEYVAVEDLPGLVMRSYLNYSLLFQKEYKEFEKIIRFHVDLLNANSTYYERFGTIIFDNFFCNYKYMVKGKSLINLNLVLPKDIPAILVSSGPSLDKNVQLLKKAKNKSFILAVDSAARVLVKNDIKPDMIMSIDPQKNYLHMKDNLLKGIPLICSLRSHNILLDTHEGDKYFLHDDNPYIEKIFKKFNKILPKLSGGGSVSTDAFGFLESLQFDKIILVGQDLAYTNNKTHSKQSFRGEFANAIDEQKCLWVEDMDGDEVLSSYEFQIYQDWFEEEIRNNSNCIVIDATEGGVKIKGTDIKPLKNVIQEECKKEVNIEEILKSVVYRLSDDEQEIFLKDIRLMPKIYEEIYEKIKILIAKTNKMLLLVNLDNLQIKQIKKLYKENSQMLMDIEKLPEFYLIDKFIEREIVQENMNIYAEKKDKGDDLIDALNISLKIFKIIKSNLEICIARSNSYVDEEKRR